MKITLHTNVFPVEGKKFNKLMSVGLMVWREEFKCSCISVPGYVQRGDLFVKSMDTVSVAADLKRMLVDLGNEVDLDPVLEAVASVNGVLLDAYDRADAQ